MTDLARWRDNPLLFIEQVLHDPETMRPYHLLPAERSFLALAFQTGEDGRLRYPEQVYSCPKKSGKTTLGALHVLTTTLLFGGNYAEAVCCANDLEQAQGRVFEQIRRIVECSPLLKSEAKVTANRISFPQLNATVSAIAADAAGAAGGNQCISCHDELWGAVSERSRRLFDEMVVPPTRKIACRLTVTYAGFEGESELLEELYRRGLSQPQVGKDLYAGDGLLMFWTHEPVAPWQTPQWVTEMRRSLRPNQYLRMIENRWVTTDSAFIDMGWYDAAVDPNARMMAANPALPIYVGIDASTKHDSSAVVAVTWDRTINKCRLVAHYIFQPSPDEPLDFETTIEHTILELKRRFSLKRVLFDPYQMASCAQRLRARGVPIVEYPQSVPNITTASQNLFELFKGGNIILYLDDAIRLAVSRAVAVEGVRGWKISKEKQSHKIDAAASQSKAPGPRPFFTNSA